CFFSPSAVEAFEKRFGVGEVTVAAIGDTTAARARALGFKIGLVASKATNSIFAQELITVLSVREHLTSDS
ncbi:MAG TPA: uroporphyrinogen-III synthase, partial [Pyrinomonadaceae bacterium]|nr:uroporphyrinogen-III synthase [Pyrinomonadaceae bacterium]